MSRHVAGKEVATMKFISKSKNNYPFSNFRWVGQTNQRVGSLVSPAPSLFFYCSHMWCLSKFPTQRDVLFLQENTKSPETRWFFWKKELENNCLEFFQMAVYFQNCLAGNQQKEISTDVYELHAELTNALEDDGGKKEIGSFLRWPPGGAWVANNWMDQLVTLMHGKRLLASKIPKVGIEGKPGPSICMNEIACVLEFSEYAPGALIRKIGFWLLFFQCK